MHSKQTTQKLSVQGTGFVNLCKLHVQVPRPKPWFSTFQVSALTTALPDTPPLPSPPGLDQKFHPTADKSLLMKVSLKFIPACKNVCFLKPAFSIKKRENSQPLLTISLMGKSKPLVQLGNGQLGWHIWQHSQNQGMTVLPTNTWASHHSYKMCWRDGFVTPRSCAPSSSFIRSQYASLLLETLVWFCD